MYKSYIYSVISGPFIPHGHCYLWKPSLVGLHVLSDSLIALAYYAISVTLVYFIWQRRDVPFAKVFLLFGFFIIACGTTHLAEVWTLWYPTYWVSGYLKAITALVSIYTVWELIPLIPQALVLPSPAQLEEKNRQLAQEIERRAAIEVALQQSQQMLQLVIDNIPQLIFWKDRNSVYLGCNQNFARVAGVSQPENIVGKTDYDLPWKREESDWFREGDAHVMETARPEYHIIEPQRQADGKQSWADTNKIPLHDAEGRVVGILGTYEDITERQQAAEALRQSEAQLRKQTTQLELTLQQLQQTQAQLVQTEKMSSLGQVVAGVAHEINNPISFIYGNLIHLRRYTQELFQLLDLYALHYPNPVPEIQAEKKVIDLAFLMEDLPKMLSSMQVGAERIHQIVLSLNNFAHQDQAKMKLVDIHKGIDSTLLLLQHRLKLAAGRYSIKVIKEYGDLPKVECYAGQINQVFMNLLTNAIEALQETWEKRIYSHPYSLGLTGNLPKQSDSTSLIVKDGTEFPTPTIWIRTEVKDSQWVAIHIVDNGLGVTADIYHKLFDPFFTTKPIGSGTGLGLAISYEIIVKRHNGQVQCLSEANQGAEFVVQIPIRQNRNQKTGNGRGDFHFWQN